MSGMVWWELPEALTPAPRRRQFPAPKAKHIPRVTIPNPISWTPRVQTDILTPSPRVSLC